jgi:hypothetical protein
MRFHYAVVISIVLTAPPLAWAQAADDTLPERVVTRAYDAFNRHDASGFSSLLAPQSSAVTILPDSGCSARTRMRDDELSRLSAALAEGGVYANTTETPLRTFAAGPYVIVEESVRGSQRETIHLYIFEVRNGYITRTLAFDAHQVRPIAP